MAKENNKIENVEFEEVTEIQTPVKAKKIDAEKAKSIGKTALKIVGGAAVVVGALLLGGKLTKGRKSSDVCEDDATDYDDGYSYDVEDDAE